MHAVLNVDLQHKVLHCVNRLQCLAWLKCRRWACDADAVCRTMLMTKGGTVYYRLLFMPWHGAHTVHAALASNVVWTHKRWSARHVKRQPLPALKSLYWRLAGTCMDVCFCGPVLCCSMFGLLHCREGDIPMLNLAAGVVCQCRPANSVKTYAGQRQVCC